MNPYISVFDIFEDNKVLKERMIQLENEIVKLNEKNTMQEEIISKLEIANLEFKENIDARNEENTSEILDYFHTFHSIRRTASTYGMEMDELYELIPQWEDCREGLKSADDYDECRIEIIGRREYDEELEKDMTKTECDFRKRYLDVDEIHDIIADYKYTKLSMYELADKYELQINYLFKVLKENKVIDREIDAKYYAKFYEEHMGSSCQWDGKSELGLIK